MESYALVVLIIFCLMVFYGIIIPLDSCLNTVVGYESTPAQDIKDFFCIIQFIHCSVVLFYPDFIWKKSIFISGESYPYLGRIIGYSTPSDSA